MDGSLATLSGGVFAYGVKINRSQALLSLSVTLASYPMNARILMEVGFCEVRVLRRVALVRE